MKKNIRNFIIEVFIFFIILWIIDTLWKIIEIRLYGWSQESAIDNAASAFISVILTECMMKFLNGGEQ